jgi:hypothetical protein
MIRMRMVTSGGYNFERHEDVLVDLSAHLLTVLPVLDLRLGVWGRECGVRVWWWWWGGHLKFEHIRPLHLKLTPSNMRRTD